jgi:hypothetical protein
MPKAPGQFRYRAYDNLARQLREHQKRTPSNPAEKPGSYDPHPAAGPTPTPETEPAGSQVTTTRCNQVPRLNIRCHEITCHCLVRIRIRNAWTFLLDSCVLLHVAWKVSKLTPTAFVGSKGATSVAVGGSMS